MTEGFWQTWFAILLVGNVAVRWIAHWRSGIFVTKNAAGHEGRSHDRCKQLIIAVSLVASVTYAVSPASMAWSQVPGQDALRWVGLVAAIVATPVHIWAFVALGRYYDSVLVVRADHQLIDHGPYRWIRHPMYASALLGGLSLALLAANVLLLATFATSLVLVVARRIPKEEAMLAEHLGSCYQDYVARTGALLPKVWRRR